MISFNDTGLQQEKGTLSALGSIKLEKKLKPELIKEFNKKLKAMGIKSEKQL